MSVGRALQHREQTQDLCIKNSLAVCWGISKALLSGSLSYFLSSQTMCVVESSAVWTTGCSTVLVGDWLGYEEQASKLILIFLYHHSRFNFWSPPALPVCPLSLFAGVVLSAALPHCGLKDGKAVTSKESRTGRFSFKREQSIAHLSRQRFVEHSICKILVTHAIII